MKTNGTLLDLALRDSLRPRDAMVHMAMRDLLLNARKFVLDYSMSSYIADLTNAAFVANPKRAVEMVEGARKLARLPHPITWIEYDCIARRRRSIEEYPQVQMGSFSTVKLEENIIPRVGWLLVQHPKLETAYTMTEFCQTDDTRCAQLPYSSTWVGDDYTVLPWKNLPWDISGAMPSAILTGILQYESDKVGCISSIPYEWDEVAKTKVSAMLKETAGELRAVWTLLATINDLPTLIETVKPSRGYVQRGRYRRFVDHTVIRLNVPAHRSVKTLAARAVATIRRRAHQVRGHWRKDWRRTPAAFCEHNWMADETALTCSHCGGKRLWIAEHQRGDAGLGVVTHDYEITHDLPN